MQLGLYRRGTVRGPRCQWARRGENGSKAGVMEIGYAISMGLQILMLEAVLDRNLAGYCRPLAEVFPRLHEGQEQFESQGAAAA